MLRKKSQDKQNVCCFREQTRDLELLKHPVREHYMLKHPDHKDGVSNWKTIIDTAVQDGNNSGSWLPGRLSDSNNEKFVHDFAKNVVVSLTLVLLLQPYN
jgi:hypothetical protein